MPPLWNANQIQGKTGGRLFLATILCGPLAGMLMIFIIALISWLMSLRSGGGAMPIAFFFSGAIFGAAIGWPAMLVFGLPAHAFLYKRRSHKIGGYLLSGALLGVLATVIITILSIVGARDVLGANLLYTGGVFGIILLLASIGASSIFWWIRRPDRDAPSPEKLAAAFE
ncbi:MAG TPA: hypothetical protein VGO52_21040 [Hyphomonadaceae bacterium]|nr:hypothetical protein [Hyphomonadaceae bacterium]